MEEEMLEKRYEEAMKVINETALPLFVEDTFEDIFLAYKQDEKIIKEMALYIRNIKTDYEQKYCNVDNCNYHNTNCSYQCIIDYFRKKCE